jgi:hypothetical protein
MIIHSEIERYFDSGVFVIVPDLPEIPLTEKLLNWMNGEVRDFKIKIIDSSFPRLNYGIVSKDGLKWRDIDNRQLKFKGSARPAARYLYFHYCLQVLRQAWRVGPGEKAAVSLYDEFGKPVWATTGRYIGKKMLRTFIDTLGHEYQDLLKGACYRAGDPSALIETATAQIAAYNSDSGDSSDTSSEGEGEED